MTDVIALKDSNELNMQLDLGSIVCSFNFLNRDSLDSVRLTQNVFNDIVELHMGAVCLRSVEYAKISLANDSRLASTQ